MMVSPSSAVTAAKNFQKNFFERKWHNVLNFVERDFLKNAM